MAIVFINHYYTASHTPNTRIASILMLQERGNLDQEHLKYIPLLLRFQL